MFQSLLDKEKKISVTGLGYVGLPLALELAKHFSVIAYDINADRISMMKAGKDPSKELSSAEFDNKDIVFTNDSTQLSAAHFHIVAVPTDLDKHKVPDLQPILTASKKLGAVLKKGDYIVYESTVYPSCTEEDCVPALVKSVKETTGQTFQAGVDFKFGYSPERINPGDKLRTISSILKIVSGNDALALEEISKVYAHIITAGVYKASSIKVAEAAKVIENIQRDINISLMNELAIIFDKMDIDTQAVLNAASTKWNFHPYQPGLVGGHCISVDPYYLLHKSRQLGHDPQVIAAGRRINDEMPNYIAKRLVQKLIEIGKNPGACKALVMGITFKENVADIRNSKVVVLVKELLSYSLNVETVDPYVADDDLKADYGISLQKEPSQDYDVIIVAVSHNAYLELPKSFFENISKDQVMLFDIKGIYDPNYAEHYWKL